MLILKDEQKTRQTQTDIFKDEAIKAVSNGKYALKGNNKVLKGNILFDKYSENIADEYTVYNLSLDCKFYEPKEKSTLLGKKIVWSEDTSITAQKGCLYFYESSVMMSVTEQFILTHRNASLWKEKGAYTSRPAINRSTLNLISMSMMF